MTHLCPCCGLQQRVYTQTAMMLGRPDYELAECRNPSCTRFMITLSPAELARLTDADALRYGQPQQRTEVQVSAELSS